jgi:hypothetical protein
MEDCGLFLKAKQRLLVRSEISSDGETAGSYLKEESRYTRGAVVTRTENGIVSKA